MDLTCVASTVQAPGGGGVTMWGMFILAHVWPFIKPANPSIVAEHVLPFTATIISSRNG